MPLDLDALSKQPKGTIWFELWDDEALAQPRVNEFHVCAVIDGRGIVVGGVLDSRWTIVALDPLTVTPSIHCVAAKGGCGLHGWIRAGRWVPA